MQVRYFFYPALVLMVSCGADEASQPQQEVTAERQAEAEAQKPDGVIPEYQLEALEKAKRVEGQLQESLEERTDRAENP